MAQHKILIVDDDKQILDLLTLYLSQETDYTVLTANSGADGLRLTVEERPDLVMLDIRMPDVNGYEVLARIREHRVPTRVIMFTGNTVRITSSHSAT